jgi:hypothetical protein
MRRIASLMPAITITMIMMMMSMMTTTMIQISVKIILVEYNSTVLISRMYTNEKVLRKIQMFRKQLHSDEQ